MPKTDINNYVSESLVRLITGNLDIGKDWDAYIENLEGMQVARYL